MTDDKELTPEELTTELEKVQAQLKKVNAESAERRVKLSALEKEKESWETKSLSETEKLQAEIKRTQEAHKALQDKLEAERVRTAVITTAIELGFASPEDAFSLTDLSAIEISDDGKVSGFEKSLKALAESGRLAMKDQKRSDGLGTPTGKGKPASDGADKAPIKIRV